MLLVVADTHTQTPTVYLCANRVIVLSYRELTFEVSRVLGYAKFTCSLLVWVYVYLLVYSNTQAGCRLELVLNKECERRGVVWRETWISGVHCGYIRVHEGGTQNAAVIMLCALLRVQLKSLNGECLRTGVLNPSAVEAGRAIEGSRALFYVALVHVRETWLINSSVSKKFKSASHFPP